MHELEILRAGGYRDKGLKRLKLTEPLDQFPEEIFELGDTLEQLDLSGTKLTSLPYDFGTRLPHLRIAFFSNCRFTIFPAVALASCPSLEMVAFRSNGMTELPEEAFAWASLSSPTAVPTPFARRLRWLILTDNRIRTLPSRIGHCERLEKCMLAGNRLSTLPPAMASCRNLTLLRLAANRIHKLPDWLFTLPKLAFLSFAANPCSTPPSDGDATPSSNGGRSGFETPLPNIDWNQIEVHNVLGEGASGVISKGLVKGSAAASTANSGINTPRSDGDDSSLPSEHVAIKVFRGALTSDGTPYDEMAACIAAGRHVNLVKVHGQVTFAEEDEEEEEKDAENELDQKEEDGMAASFKGGLVMELIPPHYRVLGLPPSFDSCTRDRFDNDGDGKTALVNMPPKTALSILAGVASAAEHLHSRGIAHGDLYAHNILVRHGKEQSQNGADGKAGAEAELEAEGTTSADGSHTHHHHHDTHAYLSDFGAATLYRQLADNEARFPLLEKVEVLAFAHLVEDVLGLMDRGASNPADHAKQVREQLTALHKQCTVEAVEERPTFVTIVSRLHNLQARVAV